MREIAENVFQSGKSAAASLTDIAPVKAAAAGAFAFAVGNHGTALCAFVALVLIDLLTKYLALSYERLTDIGASKRGLLQCLLGMPAAFKDGYIKSEPMKTKFAGKLILYMVLVLAAVYVDKMAGAQGVFLKAAWFYLASTEFVSIMENLRDAGVESLDPLLNFVRSRLGGMKS